MRQATQTIEIIGASLAVARRLRRLTQTELADRVTSPRTTIASIEHRDRTVVDEDLMLALEHELRCRRGVLAAPPAVGPAVDRLHYRKKASALLKDRVWLADVGGQMDRLVAFLLDRCKVGAPKIEANPNTDPERAAENVRRALGLRVDTPIKNMVQVAEVAGVFVGSFEGDLGVDGFSWTHGDRMLAMVRADGSSSRLRWSLAHELGHLAMGHGEASDDEVRDHNEFAANRFASALLLPRAAMWREYPSNRQTVDWTALIAMKRRWGSSLQAILYRARDLRLIDPSQYRRAQIRLSQKGWRKREPAEPPREIPRFLPTLVEGACSASLWDLETLAREACVLDDLVEVVVGRPLSLAENNADVVSLARERHRRTSN